MVVVLLLGLGVWGLGVWLTAAGGDGVGLGDGGPHGGRLLGLLGLGYAAPGGSLEREGEGRRRRGRRKREGKKGREEGEEGGEREGGRGEGGRDRKGEGTFDFLLSN